MRRAQWPAMLPVLGIAFLLAISAVTADDQKKEKQEPLDDAAFVMKVSGVNLAEVNLGRMATTQATDDEVRKFGQRMVDDHTNANNELIKLADQKRWQLAREMDQKHRHLSDKLAKMSGAEFDRQYIMHMVKGHKEAVSCFEAKAKDAQDSDLKAWVNKTLPTLKEHWRMAEDISKRIKTE